MKQQCGFVGGLGVLMARAEGHWSVVPTSLMAGLSVLVPQNPLE